MLNASSSHLRKLMEHSAYVVIVPRGRNPCDMPETRGKAGCDSNMGGVNLRRERSSVILVRAESIACERLNGFDQHGGILIHELTHAVEFANRMQSRTYEAYLQAYSQGLWRGTYIDKGPVEYLAVGAEVYFELPLNEAYRWPVRTRDELRTYDSRLFEMLREIYGDRPLIDGRRICAYKCD